MSVQSTILRADYAGNGLTKVFVVPFYFLDNDHVKILRTDLVTGAVATLTLDTDYTLDGVGSVYGGAATLATAPTTSQKLSVLRNVPYTQLYHYVENDPFPAASHEGALDQLTMEIQQLAEVVDRCLRLNETDSEDGELPVAAQRAGGYLSFDSSGAPFISLTAPFGLKLGRSTVTSILNQTVFPVPPYTPGADNLLVAAGGTLLSVGIDYVETSSTSITLLSPSPAGLIYSFRTFSSYFVNPTTAASAVVAPQTASGTINRINKTFTFTSNVAPSPMVFVAGVYQTLTTDYSAPVFVSGNTWSITFTVAPSKGPITVLLFS
jgi:hypothetical protein